MSGGTKTYIWLQRGSPGQVQLTGPLVTISKLPAYFLVLPFA